jgi:hypothetical protein
VALASVSAERAADDAAAVRIRVVVERPPLEAFHLFTAGLARWWPLREHSVSRARAMSCQIEPRPGGAVYDAGWRRVLGTHFAGACRRDVRARRP